MGGNGGGSQVFVGRSDEVARVRTVAGERGQVGRTLVVTGPRGIGRSSLLRAALTDFEGDLMWLSGSASSGSEPWAAVRNAGPTVRGVVDFARSGSDGLVASAVEDGLDPEELGRRITERYRAMPERSRPVVVVADDFHRCDPQSLALLVFLAHHNHTFDVSYVLSCPDEAFPPGAADLERLRLGGLGAAEAREALAGWTGRQVAAPVAEALARLTDGNPLLLREVAAHLDPDRLEGSRTLPFRLAVSATSRSVVAPDLERLTPRELRALACFPLGGTVPPVVLDGVTGSGPLASLLDRRLVEAVPGGYRPRRTASGWLAEDRLGHTARQDLAAALGTAWAGLDPVRSALHALDTPAPAPEVLARARRALAGADAAVDDRLAEALAWAVVGHADPPTTHDWLQLTARAERSGHLLDARDAFEQAVRAPAVDEADLPELTRWRGFLSQVADDRALAVPSEKLLSALELIRPAVVFETMTLTAWNSLLVGADVQARKYLDRARQASRSASLADRALWRLVDVSRQRAAGAARADTVREAALRWRDSSEGRGWYDDFLLATVLVEAGAHAEAEEHLFEAASAHRQAGRHATHFLTAARLQLEVATWRVGAARRTADELVDLALPGPVHVRGLDPALVRLETLTGLPPGTLHPGEAAYASEAPALAQARAERQLVDGRYREAVVGLQALARRQPPLPPEQRWLVLADLVEAQVADGEPAAGKQAHRAAGLPEPAGPGAVAAAARAAALVSPPLEIRPAFARALAVAEAEEGQVGRARALLALARRLGQLTAGPEADRLRDEAALVFAHHGLEGWRRHALALSWAPPAEDVQGRLLNSRLDEQQTRIVRLLMLGQKNKEVADRLYLSLRSLEKALTRIYAELGVASKAQMLALVRADGAVGGTTAVRDDEVLEA
ncbi:helix-turn-helix transcriptional regulator [Microlunatus antarcticus]|uniref:DNA-binding CsgD family transcriptional regulator n=1 Tax=Microlunatus antarcticus TaxID=53388 RepID=A0A7W5JUU7_9ACTN|nr:DNA-binding CsgD family transcriptional regulator [Microlunatus antarcticus]